MWLKVPKISLNKNRLIKVKLTTRKGPVRSCSKETTILVMSNLSKVKVGEVTEAISNQEIKLAAIERELQIIIRTMINNKPTK